MIRSTTYPLGLSVAIVGSAEATEVGSLSLVLNLLAELSERAIRALLRLAGGWRGSVEIRRLGLAEVGRGTSDVLVLGGLRHGRSVLSLGLCGVEVGWEAMLRVWEVL